uniref:LysE family translocator n=1 Tax=Halomonas sp. TaxID=1486246 RepID=UPI00262EC0E0|nr:LysE family translocator [Halomonas sp.]
MSSSVFLSMSAFAIAASISPGPVNLLVLSTSVKFGWRQAVPLVLGASLGFTLLLWLMGIGLVGLWEQIPWLRQLVKVAGVCFLGWLAWRLMCSNGQLAMAGSEQPAGAMTGALMQWLNPKAWMASVAGMGMFVSDGNVTAVTGFAVLWGTLCALSIGSWAWLGGRLSTWLGTPGYMRWFNRALAILLASSAVAIALG